MFQYSFTSLKINETFLFASGIFHAECHNYSFLKKLSQFSFTALSQLKVTVTFPFITEEKIQTHCRVLSGGPIPLKGVAAELHCSCRLYFLVAQGLEETWGAWQGTGRLCSLSTRHYKTKVCTVTSKTVCHANSTCCSWWRAHSAEAQVWQKVSQKLH